MSQSPPSYMDDVPVKISEKFKPPPRITLPQSIQQRLLAESSINNNKSINNYEFDLEHHVLNRMSEWKNVRMQEKNQRHERIRLRAQDQLRKIENEQKKKLNEVDYPNIQEDLSDPETETECNVISQPQQNQFYVINNFSSILTPTIVPDLATKNKINNEFANKINVLPLAAATTTVNSKNHNFNYSDFENDTSSPFDAMEMKTINNFDILAQVLKQSINITHSNANNNNNNNNAEEQIKDEEEPKEEIKSLPVDTNAFAETLNNFQDIQQNTYYSNNYTQQYGSNLLNSNPLTAYNPFRQTNITSNKPHYLFPISTQQSTQQQPYYGNFNNSQYYFNNHLPPHVDNMPATSTSVISIQNYAPQYNYTNQLAYLPNNATPTTTDSTKNKSKSKSVPDIMKELDNEIKNSEMRRARNNSQTVHNHSSENSTQQSSIKFVANENFNKLSQSSQLLAKNISSMGFPLERVAMIAQKFGNNDKKIIEHLIPLSELLDLGFEESMISDALIKFDNNKDKALDFLIS